MKDLSRVTARALDPLPQCDMHVITFPLLGKRGLQSGIQSQADSQHAGRNAAGLDRIG